jgi:hypothetical protein
VGRLLCCWRRALWDGLGGAGAGAAVGQHLEGGRQRAPGLMEGTASDVEDRALPCQAHPLSSASPFSHAPTCAGAAGLCSAVPCDAAAKPAAQQQQ